MEICVDSLESARNAIDGGAARLEVCSALSEGGLTPSPGLLRQIKSFATVPIHAMLRTRSGNFVYTREEMEVMLYDLETLLDVGADGFVFGALTPDNRIDVKSCEDVLRAAGTLPVTFHRAFDEVDDAFGSLEILIDLGFRRVLTSGQKDTAEEGLARIQGLVRQARDRIIVMPGSGINADNILRIKMASEAAEFHASAKQMAPLHGGANRVRIGAARETNRTITDRVLVQKMVSLLRNAA